MPMKTNNECACRVQSYYAAAKANSKAHQHIKAEKMRVALESAGISAAWA
jgi:hypothetical protein